MSNPTSLPDDGPLSGAYDLGRVTLVFPPVSDDKVSADLRHLTELLVTGGHVGDQTGGYGLGGEYGYGVEFENDTFAFFPYYWGDCTCGRERAEGEWDRTHTHTDACYQMVIRARGFLDYDHETDLTYKQRQEHNEPIVEAVCAEMGLDPEYGSYVHCTCAYDSDWAAWVAINPHAATCGIDRPNFRHKPTGTTVSFYKYIGRGMKVELHGPWTDVFNDVLASLTTKGTAR